MVPIDEAGNSEKWTCTVRGNTHNTFSSLFVMFLLWCFLCLLHRCLCLFFSFLSFTSSLPSSFVLLFLCSSHSMFRCFIVGFVSSFLFYVSLLLYLHRLWFFFKFIILHNPSVILEIKINFSHLLF